MSVSERLLIASLSSSWFMNWDIGIIGHSSKYQGMFCSCVRVWFTHHLYCCLGVFWHRRALEPHAGPQKAPKTPGVKGLSRANSHGAGGRAGHAFWHCGPSVMETQQLLHAAVKGCNNERNKHRLMFDLKKLAGLDIDFCKGLSLSSV